MEQFGIRNSELELTSICKLKLLQLSIARTAVKQAIEQNEAQAMEWMNQRLKALGVSLS